MEAILRYIIPNLSRSFDGLTAHLAKELGVQETDVIKAFDSFFSHPSDSLDDIRKEIKAVSIPKPQIWIGKYTNNTFVIGGDTKPFSSQLKNTYKGLWKPTLTRVDKVWMFHLRKWNEIETFLKSQTCVLTEDNQYYRGTELAVTKVEKKTPSKIRVVNTTDGHMYSPQHHFLFKVIASGKKKSLHCVGYRVNKNDEQTVMLTLDDVEKLNKLGYTYDEAQVDKEENDEEDEEYDIEEKDISEGEEDGDYDEDD